MSKVLLILLDGMRPDALGNIPLVDELKKTSTWCMDAKTVLPSVTLPCHMSLFHSVDPDRHGTTTNTYAPQVRPINGLCEVIKAHKKNSAFFYSWEQLRDIARPASLAFSALSAGKLLPNYSVADENSLKLFMDFVPKYRPDFVFLYFGKTDASGHGNGWMSDLYLEDMAESWDRVERALVSLPEEYTVIITADHGGHERTHGSNMPEDTTIPMFFKGPAFEPGKELHNLDIKDLAPTIAKILDCDPDEEWEGTSVI